MNAVDYLEWSRLSGLYLRNLSHIDRYQTFRPLISAPGLTTVIVAEFLEASDDILNVGTWRTHHVYEVGSECEERISLTAEALETIGANRAATAVRTAKSHSPFDKITELISGKPGDLSEIRQFMESTKGIDLLNHFREHVARAMPDLAEKAGIQPQIPQSIAEPAPDHEARGEIEALLERYIAAHRSELESDLIRHGDPRSEAGFTLAGRQRELDQLRQTLLATEAQQRDAEAMQNLMKKIDKTIAKPQKDDRKKQHQLKTDVREFRKLLKEARRQPTNEIAPELSVVLQKAEAFVSSHAEIFEPKKWMDDTLAAKLAAIGEYELADSSRLQIQWDQPVGFDCDWTNFSITASGSKKDPQTVERLIMAIKQTQGRFSSLVQEWRDALIESFRETYLVQMSDWELEDYELYQGEPNDGSILKHAGEGAIVLEMESRDGPVRAMTHFPVAWDEEHGFQIEWQIEFDELPTSGDIDFKSLLLEDQGPSLSEADIAHFETRFSLRLPVDYRQFLLNCNGGRSRRNGFSYRDSGMTFEGDVTQWFFISGQPSTPYPEGSLESAIEHVRNQHWPPEIVPIASACYVGDVDMMDGSSQYLGLILSGKRAGRILLIPQITPPMLPGFASPAIENMVTVMAEQLKESSVTVSKSFADFLSKLTEPDDSTDPVWLKAIRNDDVEMFRKWIGTQGKLNDKYQGRGMSAALKVADYLALEASPAILETAIKGGIQREQLRKSWERYGLGIPKRIRILMQVFPKSMWDFALASPLVWDDPTLWEDLASSGIDFNEPITGEGATPIQIAVQCGNQDAVKWLMQHGADPEKVDNYRRNAFTWAERGPGYECLSILQRRDESIEPDREPQPDVPGTAVLWQAASLLPQGVSLVLEIQIKSPPVSRIEQAMYRECHYRLSIDIQRQCVTFNDMNSPRQDYLFAEQWPSVLYAPVVEWPQLTPLWETVKVHEFDWNKALKQRKYEPTLRPELRSAAHEALRQSLNTDEATVRKIRLRK